MKMLIAVFIGFTIFSFSCTSSRQDASSATPANIFMEDMPPMMHFHGFTVYRPTDERWFVNKREQSPIGVIFRIENPSPTHTFSAIIQARKIAITPKTKEELKKGVTH